MENKMNDQNKNNSLESDNAHLIEQLRVQPGFENCTEEQLQNMAADIKELALLLHQLANLEDSTEE